MAGLALRRVIFESTPLENPGSGGVGSLGKITLKDLTAYYQNFYTQSNLVFGLASSFNEKQIRAAIAKIASPLPEGPKNTTPTVELKTPKTPTIVVVDKGGTATGTVFFGQGGIVAQDPERFTLDVGNFSFGGEPLVSRLFRTIRGELGWTYSISSTYSVLGALSNQKGLYAIVSTPSVEFTTKTLRKTLELWKKYLAEGLNKDEMSLAQESSINSYPFDFESADKRVAKRLYSHVYGVPILTPAQYRKTIEEVNNNRLKRALSERHTPDGWYITIVAEADALAKQLAQEQKDLPKKTASKSLGAFCRMN